jgi:hypothetical protein
MWAILGRQSKIASPLPGFFVVLGQKDNQNAAPFVDERPAQVTWRKYFSMYSYLFRKLTLYLLSIIDYNKIIT